MGTDILNYDSFLQHASFSAENVVSRKIIVLKQTMRALGTWLIIQEVMTSLHSIIVLKF
jgi:hypothetical protein